jgi:hypothetical protein
MEGTATVGGNGKAPHVRGRKAKDKQEAVIKLTELSPAIVGTLVADLKHAQEAGKVFGDGIVANAKRAGIEASVLRRFITARAGEDFEEKKRDAQQLSLLFEELGQ